LHPYQTLFVYKTHNPYPLAKSKKQTEEKTARRIYNHTTPSTYQMAFYNNIYSLEINFIHFSPVIACPKKI
jgi:hypothetical protein